MDDPRTPAGHGDSKEKDRSRPPPFPQTASRSSTSSSKTRMTSQSSPSAHGHRFHHNSCHDPSTAERPRLNLSQESTPGKLRQSLPPVSDFLQERLQKERRAESERTSSRMSADTTGSSMDRKTVQSSPARPRSSGGSGGGGESSKNKDLGISVKGTQQALSLLHKQNFDLKLEVYHRREKQSELEGLIEELESDKRQVENMNDELVAELEKRDKAVQEAVELIILLEAQRNQLLKEREAVQQIEADGYALDRAQTPLRFTEPGRSTPKPKPLPANLLRPGDAKVINRMPSFMTEMSDNTGNLRDVYYDSQLGGRDNSKGISSPSISVLSQSSFMSVYGQRKVSASSEDNSAAAVDGTSENDETVRINGKQLFAPTSHKTAPSRSGQRNSSINSIPPNAVQEALEADSPLQRLEKLERKLGRDDFRPASRAVDPAGSNRQSKLQAYPKTKQEKRDALQKVLTGVLPTRDFDHAALPPTPDTISTSTLRKYKKSSDTLPRQFDNLNDRAYPALSDVTSTSDGRAQPASITAFDSRKGLVGSSVHDSSFGWPHPPRPHSAGATTISRHHPLSDYESDDSIYNFDDDIWLQEGAENGQANALDPMMSASQAGGRRKQARASPDLFSFPSTTKGWATDKMFGNLHGDGVVGAGGQISSGAPLAQTLDALGDSLPNPLYGSGLASPALAGVAAAPPPPSRRSSLQATTGSGAVIIGSGTVGISPARPSPANGKLRKSPVRSSRTRSNSIDAQTPPTQEELGLRQERAATMPPREMLFGRPPPTPTTKESASPAQLQQQLPKQRHYPPTASQAPRSRGLSLFRRSTGTAEPPKLDAPASAPATEYTFKNAPQAMVGIPSWGRRSTVVDDDMLSATPPPIMRKHPRWTNVDDGGGVPLNAPDAGGAPVGVIPGTVSVTISQDKPPGTSGSGGEASVDNGVGNTLPNPAITNSGGRRKWLGLGRVGSLRNHRAT